MTTTAGGDDLQAQIGIAHAALRVATAEVENLQAALVPARTIGIAVGIIMSRAQLTYDAAFDVLSRASQDRNRALREIAENVVRTGTL